MHRKRQQSSIIPLIGLDKRPPQESHGSGGREKKNLRQIHTVGIFFRLILAIVGIPFLWCAGIMFDKLISKYMAEWPPNTLHN